MSSTTPSAPAAQWNSTHGDMRNSDLVSARLDTQYEVAWRVLEGAAVLFGPSVDAGGNLYVCSGSRCAGWRAQEFDDEGLVLPGDLGPRRVVAVDHEDQLVAGCLDLRQLGEPLLVLS